jgi:hypothetical protein
MENKANFKSPTCVDLAGTSCGKTWKNAQYKLLNFTYNAFALHLLTCSRRAQTAHRTPHFTECILILTSFHNILQGGHLYIIKSWVNYGWFNRTHWCFPVTWHYDKQCTTDKQHTIYLPPNISCMVILAEPQLYNQGRSCTNLSWYFRHGIILWWLGILKYL